MAARGSHWSFAEKARFEAALRRHGPFAWDDIILAVASRTEKQVKAYAARYRRRRKVAAKIRALPMHVGVAAGGEERGEVTSAADASASSAGGSSDGSGSAHSEEQSRPVEENAISDLLDISMLGTTGEAEVSETGTAPSEIDLLLDRAIEGVETEVDKPLVTLGDGDPVMFLANMFRQ